MKTCKQQSEIEMRDTRYSANATKGKWRYASIKARLPKGNGDMHAAKRD